MRPMQSFAKFVAQIASHCESGQDVAQRKGDETWAGRDAVVFSLQ